MAELIGLTNFKKKAVIKKFCHSVNEHMTELKKHRFATSAGDYGSINVWKDDKGMYRGSRCVYQSERSAHLTASLKSLKEWLTKNYPLIINGD